MAALKTLFKCLLKSTELGKSSQSVNNETESRKLCEVWTNYTVLDVITSATELYHQNKSLLTLSFLADIITTSPNTWAKDLYKTHQRKKIQTAFREFFQVGRVPSFSKREHHSFTEEDFIGVSAKCEVVLKVTNKLIEKYQNIPSSTSRSFLPFLKWILPDLLILLMENLETNLWTSEQSQASANKIINKILLNLSVDDIEQLLQYDLDAQTQSDITTSKSQTVYKVLTIISPNLTRDHWKHYPGLKIVFTFCLFHIRFPHSSYYLENVLPPALLFVDDYMIENKVLGIKCLHHVILNVSGEELGWYGRAEVIFEALKHQLYIHEVPVIEVSIPAVLAILNVVEKSPEKISPPITTRHMNRYDDVFQKLLEDAECESNLALRRAYTCHLDEFMNRMGITVVRHSKRLIRLITNYLEVYDGPRETSRFNVLKLLEMYIKVAWPRIECHLTILVQSLLKFLYDISVDNTTTPQQVKSELAGKAKVCLVLLKSCVGDEFHKMLSPLIKADLPKIFNETLSEILLTENEK